MPRVLNRNRSANWSSDNAVFVGRPSKFGNRHPIGWCSKCRRVHTRADAIIEFREDLENNPKLIEAVKQELAGKDLVCFCKPFPCHADILLEVANANISNQSQN